MRFVFDTLAAPHPERPEGLNPGLGSGSVRVRDVRELDRDQFSPAPCPNSFSFKKQPCASNSKEWECGWAELDSTTN